MNLAIWLERAAQIGGERPALHLGHTCVADYAQFCAAARAVAGGLAARGVKPGDRVALFMKNMPEYLVAMYGVWMAGAAVVPVNAKLHPHEAAWIIGDAEAVLCLAGAGQADDLAGDGCPVVTVGSGAWEALLAHSGLGVVHRGSDDLAWLFYTSGTTGRPKGVVITHGMLMAMSLSYLADCDVVSAGDAAVYAAPLSHGAGLYNMMHVRAGARHVFPSSGGFDAVEVLDLAQGLGSVHMFAAPTMVKRLTQAARLSGMSGAGLRTVVYAGGPMYQADIEEAVATFGPVFVQIYGQGECPMGITALGRSDIADRSHPRWQARLASVGRAQSAVEVRIMATLGVAAVAEMGEIEVRGDVVMPGYWQNAAATDGALVGGWLRTGDVGFIDSEGYVTLMDRSRDMIISGGSNIYPREVEEVLLVHPGVREVSVVGRPHPEWGEEVVAFVVPVAGARVEPDALDALCLSRIARFKRPKVYVLVAELPKNNYGKVLKTELRARALNASS